LNYVNYLIIIFWIVVLSFRQKQSDLIYNPIFLWYFVAFLILLHNMLDWDLKLLSACSELAFLRQLPHHLNAEIFGCIYPLICRIGPPQLHCWSIHAHMLPLQSSYLRLKWFHWSDMVISRIVRAEQEVLMEIALFSYLECQRSQI